jgi:hypothetical protein
MFIISYICEGSSALILKIRKAHKAHDAKAVVAKGSLTMIIDHYLYTTHNMTLASGSFCICKPGRCRNSLRNY